MDYPLPRLATTVSRLVLAVWPGRALRRTVWRFVPAAACDAPAPRSVPASPCCPRTDWIFVRREGVPRMAGDGPGRCVGRRIKAERGPEMGLAWSKRKPALPNCAGVPLPDRAATHPEDQPCLSRPTHRPGPRPTSAELHPFKSNNPVGREAPPGEAGACVGTSGRSS